MRCVPVAILFACVTSASLACVPSENYEYDRISSPDSVVAIARITSTAAIPWGENGACLLTTYSAIEKIHGDFPDIVTVELCADDLSPQELSSSKYIDEKGFVSGAEVLVGLIRSPSRKTGFRYAIPTCWGRLHERLDTISEEQRSEWMRVFREEFLTR